jgi:guanylate kinase
MAGIAADGPGTLVLAGPSGVGKGTLIHKLKAEYGEVFGFSVSHTTRDPRPGEVDKVHYNFVEKDLMEKEIADGLFLESANVSDNSAPNESRSVRFVARCQVAGMGDVLGASSQLPA